MRFPLWSSWQKISDPRSIHDILKQVYADHSTNVDKVFSRIVEITQHPAAAASFASIMFAPRGQISFQEAISRWIRLSKWSTDILHKDIIYFNTHHFVGVKAKAFPYLLCMEERILGLDLFGVSKSNSRCQKHLIMKSALPVIVLMMRSLR